MADGALGTPRGRSAHAVAVKNGRGYLFGGEAESGAAQPVRYADVWSYDFASHSWTNHIPPASPGAPAASVNVGFAAQ